MTEAVLTEVSGAGVGVAAPLGTVARGAIAPVTTALETVATMPAAAGMTTTTATIAQETVTAQEATAAFRVGQSVANSRGWPSWLAGSEYAPIRRASDRERR